MSASKSAETLSNLLDKIEPMAKEKKEHQGVVLEALLKKPDKERHVQTAKRKFEVVEGKRCATFNKSFAEEMVAKWNAEHLDDPVPDRFFPWLCEQQKKRKVKAKARLKVSKLETETKNDS